MDNGNKYMARIEGLAKRLAEVNSNLMAEAEELTEALDDIKKQYVPSMLSMAKRVAKLRKELEIEVDAHPEFFKKPKSRVINAVKFGLRKKTGSLSWSDDDDIIVARIRKQHPENADILISVKESPSKDGLAKLSGEDLKKLGVTITDDSDVPFVKLDDGDGYKIAGELVDLAEKAAAGKDNK